MCPRKQTTEPNLLILVSFFSGEVTSYTDTSYCKVGSMPFRFMGHPVLYKYILFLFFRGGGGGVGLELGIWRRGGLLRVTILQQLFKHFYKGKWKTIEGFYRLPQGITRLRIKKQGVWVYIALWFMGFQSIISITVHPCFAIQSLKLVHNLNTLNLNRMLSVKTCQLRWEFMQRVETISFKNRYMPSEKITKVERLIAFLLPWKAQWRLIYHPVCIQSGRSFIQLLRLSNAQGKRNPFVPVYSALPLSLPPPSFSLYLFVCAVVWSLIGFSCQEIL